jgi:phenylacetate-CoA ligase
LSSKQCTCGRVLPLLERIEGRSNDCIVSPDGRIINSLALIYAIREVAGVERFQVRQKQMDWFTVQIVRGREFPRDAEARIQGAWTGLVRAPIRVDFEYLSALPAETSGKFRHVISDIPEGQDPRRRDDYAALETHGDKRTCELS